MKGGDDLLVTSIMLPRRWITRLGGIRDKLQGPAVFEICQVACSALVEVAAGGEGK